MSEPRTERRTCVCHVMGREACGWHSYAALEAQVVSVEARIAEVVAAREAEIRAAVEGLADVHEVGLDDIHCAACKQFWPCDSAKLLAAIGSPAPLPHFEPDHFRAIWFENVRVFENEEGTGWRCLDDETGEVADGATPEAAIAAMFGAKAAIGQTAAPRLDRHTSECIEWMYRITAEATGDRACICGAVLGSPAAPRLDRERLARALNATVGAIGWMRSTPADPVEEWRMNAAAIADAYEADQP